MVYQIIGSCGVGKTWVMKKIIEQGKFQQCKLGLFRYMEDGTTMILGKYDGSMFEGSDKLSMAIAKDFQEFNLFTVNKKYTIICEGDRFMNQKFFDIFKPTVLKINGDGRLGREKRNSKQSEQHIKRIDTRVKKYKFDKEFNNSEECLTYLKQLCDDKN